MPKTVLRPAAEDTSDDVVDVRLYECAVLYPYGLGQKEENELIKEIEGYFSEVGATIVQKDPWGRRGLAYPIKGATEANITIYYVMMDPLRLKEVDQSFKIARGVLRHLFVKPPKHIATPGADGKYSIPLYGPLYEQWLKERVSIGEMRAREKEEQLQTRVAEKAKRKAKMTTDRKKEDEPKTQAMKKEAITEKIDELIAGDSLDL